MAGNGVNVGHGNISISPVLVPGFAANLQRQLNSLHPQPTINVGVNVDQRGLNGLNQQINNTSSGGLNLKKVLAGAVAVLSAKALKDKYDAMYQMQNRFVALSGAATAAGGVIGSLVGVIGGLGAGLAVAGAGVGAFAALAAPQIKTVTTATTAASTAQDAYNTAIATGDTKGAQKALEDRRAALATLTPAQRAATEATLNLKDAFKKQSDALAPVTLGVYTKGITALRSLLPALTPVAQAAGSALSGIFDRIQVGIGSTLAPGGGLFKFLDVVKATIGPVLNQLATIVTNLGVTFSETFQAFGPLIEPALAMISRLTGALADGAGSDAFYDFVASLQPLLPPLEAAIKSIAGAFGAFVRAAVPLAGPVLGAVKAVGDALRNLFNSTQFSGFVQNIGSAITSLTPLLSALVGPIGNVLETISAQFAALAPSLVPLITSLANAFSSVLVGLSPLLPIFVQLANIFVGFIPILYPLIQAFRAFLVPILQAFGQVLIAIMPAVNSVVQAIVPLAPLFGQLLASLAPLIAQLINAFAPVLVTILQAMQPLIPVVTQIVTQFGGAFVQALQILLPALIPLIPPLTQLVIALLQLTVAALQPMLPLLQVFAYALVGLATVLAPVIRAFTWWINLIRPAVPYLLALVSPVFLLIDAVTLLVKFWTFAWNTVIFPLIKAAAPLFIWLYQNVVLPAFNGIRAALSAVATAFSWAWNNILHPILNAFAAVAKFVALILLTFVFAPLKLGWIVLSTLFKFYWDNVLHPVFKAVASVANWLWNNVLKPVFGWIGAAWGFVSAGIKKVWDTVLHPVLHAVGVVAGDMKKAFGAAVDGIKGIWNSLKKIFAEPINAVIYPIVRNLAHAVDAVTDFALHKRPLQAMESLKDVHFARGGVVPGNHNRDDVPIYATPGEVVVPKHVVGAMGGPHSLMSTLGFGPNAGGPGAHFSLGGIVHGLTHNPVTNAIGSGAKAVVGGVKKVGSLAFDAGSWALDGVVGLLRAGAADAFDGAYRAFSGPLFGLLGNGTVPQMMRGVVDNMERTAVDFIRGKEASDGLLGGDAISWNGGANTVGLIEQLARGLPGGNAMQVTSTTGGRHAGGSYHGRGEAVDFSNGTGNTPQMLAFDRAFAAKYGSSLAELIYTAPGSVFVKDGAAVPGGYYSSVLDQHRNHVHVAISPASIARGHQKFMPFNNAGGPAGQNGIVQAVHQAAAARGWGGQLGALDYIVQHESSWNPNAKNPGSTASGLFQLLYGAGNGVQQQITNGLNYIAQRYGDPAHAQRFWASHHWYDDGGYLMPGATAAFNGTNRPEPVFTSAQWKILAGNLKAGVSSGGSDRPLIGTAYIREEADANLLARQLGWLEREGQA